MIKMFLINFFAISCGVWFTFAIIWGPYIVAYNYHWPVMGLEAFAFVCAVWSTILENNEKCIRHR